MKKSDNRSVFLKAGVILLAVAFVFYLFSLRVYSVGFWNGIGVIVLASAGLLMLYACKTITGRVLAVCIGLIILSIVLIRVLASLFAIALLALLLLFPIGIVLGAFFIGRRIGGRK